MERPSVSAVVLYTLLAWALDTRSLTVVLDDSTEPLPRMLGGISSQIAWALRCPRLCRSPEAATLTCGSAGASPFISETTVDIYDPGFLEVLCLTLIVP